MSVVYLVGFFATVEKFKKLGPHMGRELASIYIGPNLPADMLDTARCNFAPDATIDNTIGMISESLLDTGRSGILFTDKKNDKIFASWLWIIRFRISLVYLLDNKYNRNV